MVEVKVEPNHEEVVSNRSLLSVRQLSVVFAARDHVVRAVDRVSFDIAAGETFGIVGETGCGKSMTMRSLIRLQQPGAIIGGTATFEGVDLLQMSESELRQVRGRKIGMIPQDPGSALNPVLTIGSQLCEVLRVKRGLPRRDAKTTAVELLDRVGIASANRRMRDYSHQLSGGMRQRVMIAMAIASSPQLLLADEPTTALDVTVQDQILTLLVELCADNKMALVIVSHDLGVIGQVADRVAVMYAGRVMETGSYDEVLNSPAHPYTEALIRSAPTGIRSPDGELLRTVRGQPPDLTDLPSGCPFRTRCDYAEEACASSELFLDLPIGPMESRQHKSACLFPERTRH
jgi:oligopeptide/dipeptide ABC transporter ATP-binding protein